MVKSGLIFSVILSAVICGCDPYRFTVETQQPVECRIFSDHTSVDSHLYGFDMKPDATVGMKSKAWTQYFISAYLTLHGGDGFKLMVRPVVEEGIRDPGFTLTFSKTSLVVDSAGTMIVTDPDFRFPRDSQMYVTIYNEESFVQITIGCDTILKRYTKQKSSDEIALQTLGGSELKVLDPRWRRIQFTKATEVKAEDSP